jgi:hypothetical protein
MFNRAGGKAQQSVGKLRALGSDLRREGVGERENERKREEE